MVHDVNPVDLTSFMRACELAPTIDPTFAADALAAVESAWQIPDTTVASFGWVVALKGGPAPVSRVHAGRYGEGHAGGSEHHPLAAGETYQGWCRRLLVPA
jgi:hypothetical protein